MASVLNNVLGWTAVLLVAPGAFDAAMERVDEDSTRPPTWVAYRLRPASVEL